MTRRRSIALVCLAAVSCGSIVGCGAHANQDTSSGAPPTVAVDREDDGAAIRVDHPEQFPIVVATTHTAAPELSVTGVVSPDVSRTVPVVSLTSGRVVDIRARLGDRVEQGQVLLRIQSADVSSALADYRKAQSYEALAAAQLDREKGLFQRGAVAKKDVEVAEDTAYKASVDVVNSANRLRLLGGDPEHDKGGPIDVVAPASGIITEQNVTAAGGVRTLDNSPNLFTIADLARVWVICDVPENQLPLVREGDHADIRVEAYPNAPVTGRIANIGAVLDPTIRTAKVRIEVANGGLLRFGMFVTATFHGQTMETRPVVPASAVLHLRDHDWVYAPVDPARFARREVVAGRMLPGNMQELRSGLRPGDRVAKNALVLQNTAGQ